MNCLNHSPEDITIFKEKALQWAVSFGTASYFDSNGYLDPFSSFDVLIAAGVKTSLECSDPGAFEKLGNFLQHGSEWALGFLGYDLKNHIEALSSGNPDQLEFPELFFFHPEHLLKIKGNKVEIWSSRPEETLQAILLQTTVPARPFRFSERIKSRFSLADYLKTVEQIKEHIQRGDIYEMNLCQEFYAENTEIDPLFVYSRLNKISPTPFSAFFKHDARYIISASPERFLRRKGETLISQPIKGTAKRSLNSVEDEERKNRLRNNKKEQAENVMIVDLVRNDLTKCSVPGSVSVQELFGIYSFRQVHQMISTITSLAQPELNNSEIIKRTFPMGSMTGAPKIRAMELIDEFERSRRGVFSGAVGYFSPEGDFDFNVVIRSILYNASKRYLSFQVGSAITYASDAKKEYEECLIKAEAIREVLDGLAG